MPEPERCNSPIFYCLTNGLSRGLEDFRALWDAEEIGLTRHICFADSTNQASISTHPRPGHQVRAYI